MLWPLDVLVVDDALGSVRFLTEYLNQRCRKVDTAATAQAALAAAVRHRAMKEPYQVVFLDYVLQDMDGLQLMAQMQAHQADLSFVFITAYRQLNPHFESQAVQQGALAVLDKPVDLGRVEALLGNTARFHRRKESEASGDQPFFGTGRIRRPVAAPVAPVAPAGEALERREPDPNARATASYRAQPEMDAGGALEPRQYRTPQPGDLPPPTRDDYRSPLPVQPSTGYQRRPSGLIAMTGSTARLRRGVTPSPEAAGQPGTGIHQPVTGYTARVRRSTTGTDSVQRPPEIDPASMRQVLCASCGQAFAVPRKAEAYATVCVHCGQLQRVDPQ